MGINIYNGYDLHEIQTNEDEKGETCEYVVIRKKSDRYDEIIEKIDAIKKVFFLKKKINDKY